MTTPTSFPKDKIRIALLENVHSDGADLLSDEGFDVRTFPGALAGAELADAIADAHAIGIRSKTRLTAEALAGGRRLLAVGCFCAGTNQVELDAAASAGAPVFNAPYSNTRSVAELTIAEVVMLCRRAGERSMQMHRGEWNKSASGAHEVRGRTLGIVGYGHIGSQVSVLAESMGMRVVYFDVASKLPLGNAAPAASLDEVMRTADVVTLHVPATESTRGLIGARELGLMKPGAALINNARGSVIDLEALAAGIREDRIGGAALDVFPDEPSASGERFESPVRGLDRVILTPHVGGSTVEAQAAIAREVAGKLARFINDGSTIGAVNVPEVDLPDQTRAGAPDQGVERPHRVLHFHKNVPGVMGKLHGVISELGVNVTGERLQTRGEIGYVVLDVAPTDAGALTERLRGIEETIRTRVLW